MPNYVVEHTYTRTDVYYVEAASAAEAAELVQQGEVECEDKEDFLPETTAVFAADDQFNYGDKPLLKEVRDA